MATDDPWPQVQVWMREAEAAGPGAEAVALATATPDGRPSVRVVLCRGADPRGFVFFTGYGSRKGREMELNPRAALCFHWPSLGRQLRAEGDVDRVSAAESDAYFATRARGSQLGAWASPQSQPISGREVLEEGVAAAEARFAGRAVERPPDWGGHRLLPEVIEFWESRPSRLHDRIRYRRAPGGGWLVDRLAP
ncbi:MAG TPA: pyridoxamine 5'-phosphate oxidase [Bacillota bacterium]|nr:pyridoxamine 5'-phosphate oxidase [Bacillota bacterium]